MNSVLQKQFIFIYMHIDRITYANIGRLLEISHLLCTFLVFKTFVS